MAKESPIRQRMQSFYFEFLNEDGTVREVLTDTEEGVEEEGEPSEE